MWRHQENCDHYHTLFWEVSFMLKKVHAVMGPLSSASYKVFEFLPYNELLIHFQRL